MKKYTEAIDFVSSLIDATADRVKSDVGAPNVNPSLVINFNSKTWRPLILSMETDEERGSLKALSKIAGFAFGVANRSASLPEPVSVSIIAASEMWKVNEDENAVQSDPTMEGYSISAVTVFNDGESSFNTRNIAMKWDDNAGIVPEVTKLDELSVGKEDSDDFVWPNDLPTNQFWNNYKMATNTWDKASDDLKVEMEKDAKRVFAKYVTRFLANKELKQLHHWS